MRMPENKIMDLGTALGWRAELRSAGTRLVVTNGCFDLMHRGHVDYLVHARLLGEALLVGVNSDASIGAIKGPSRPIVPEKHRLYMLAALECVDAIVVFSTTTATDLLRSIAPDVYAKGGDYSALTLVQEEYRMLQQMGCEIRLLPLVTGVSTTDIVARIRSSEDERAP